MPFGWRRRQPLEQHDAAAEKAEVQRVRKRDLLRQLFTGVYAEKKQPRAASIPSIVEPEVRSRPLSAARTANMTLALQRKSRIVEPFRGLKKHYRSRSSFVKTADDDKSTTAAASSTADLPAAQPAQPEETEDARSEAPDDVSTPDPSGA